MAFLKKVIDHLLNQVLVETLSNSRTFQRFAVWSHSKVKELNSKGKDGGAALDEQAAKVMEQSKLAWQKWREEFAEEMQKAQQQGKGGEGGRVPKR